MLFHPVLNAQKILGNVKIRHLRRADLPALEWEGEFTHFRPMFERAYRRTESGEAAVWVADYAQQLIGQAFVQLRSRRNVRADGYTRAYIYAVRVRPAYQNMGLGGRLMCTVENDLIWRGYKFATLNVARDNPDAQRFYERLGYCVAGEEEGRWSYTDHLGVAHLVHEPAWRMEKALTSRKKR
jgi:ribosomal protein S18 acetylase RimI-like enzyme